MSLEVPRLDDRDFAAILEDARKRIPVYAPGWTDHNVHDPGITFVELFAWLAEAYGYQLDQVTDAHRRKFLRLLGTAPRPPQPAAGRLQVTAATDGSLAGHHLPAGTPVLADDDGETRRFRTTRETTLTAATIGRVVTDSRDGRTDDTRANETAGLSYPAFGAAADAESALYLGFVGDPFADADSLSVFVSLAEDALVESGPHDEEPFVRPADAVGDPHGEANPGGDTATADPGGDTATADPGAFDPSVSVRWEYCVTPDYGTWYDPDAWAPVPVRDDGTTAFYRSGTVVLEKPPATDEAPAWVGRPGTVGGPGRILDVNEPYRWLRCVVVRDGHEIPPVVESLRPNVVAVTHGRVRRVRLTPAGEEDGSAPGDAGPARTSALPNQRFAVGDAPLRPDPVRLWVGGASWDDAAVETWRAGPDPTPAPGFTEWHEVSDFDAAGPDDRVFVLDRTRGVVQFGDGVAGAVPRPAQVVLAVVDVGGGEAGNVGSATRWSFAGDHARLAVTALGPTTGGEAAESVDDALRRVRVDLSTPYRCVTPDDFAFVARATPPLRVARAAARLVTEAAVDDCPPHERVVVVVVPDSPSPRPTPSAGFRDAVECHLRRHALLTDRVAVAAPTYVGVGVAVEVGLQAGYGVAERTAAVTDALDAFLHPLTGFGGDGWPFGRDVYLSEVYEVVEAVAGIDCVFDVSLTARGGALADGDVVVPETALVTPETHDVTVRTETGRCGRGDS
jgi:predicted phage baseplate assembly protein